MVVRRRGDLGALKFTDRKFWKDLRFSVGVEEASGRHYLAIPVSNQRVDYEEYYAIDRVDFERFCADPNAAAELVERCRRREADDRLIVPPGKWRGSSG